MQRVDCTINLDVSLGMYVNPTSEDCDGGNCEAVIDGVCDNVFMFCLQEVNSAASPCNHGRISTNDIESDSFSFTATSVLNMLGLSSNIVSFMEVVPTVSMCIPDCINHPLFGLLQPHLGCNWAY